VLIDFEGVQARLGGQENGVRRLRCEGALPDLRRAIEQDRYIAERTFRGRFRGYTQPGAGLFAVQQDGLFP
jgi:hypothetical protein